MLWILVEDDPKPEAWQGYLDHVIESWGQKLYARLAKRSQIGGWGPMGMYVIEG